VYEVADDDARATVVTAPSRLGQRRHACCATRCLKKIKIFRYKTNIAIIIII